MALTVTPILGNEALSGGPSLASGVLNRALKELQDYINAAFDWDAGTPRLIVTSGTGDTDTLRLKKSASTFGGFGFDTVAANNRLGLWLNGIQQLALWGAGMALGAYATSATHPPANGLVVSGKVGIGTVSPATSAILELAGTTGSLILTRLSTGNRDALTAVEGMVIYNTSTGTVQFHNGTAWANI